MSKIIEFIGTVDYRGICFNKDFKENHKIGDLTRKFHEFIKEKKDLCAGGLNRYYLNKIYFDKVYSTDGGVSQYFLKGNMVSENNYLNEEKVYSYIKEFAEKYEYDIKIERIFNSNGETEFFPIEELPKYVYQYTSIETLERILTNKTIRFNSLSNVDDIEEKYTTDFGDYGRFCFVTCWVAEEKELVPMWEMYGDKMKGVRIKLPVNPFEKFENNFSKIEISNGEVLEYKGFIVSPPYKANLFNIYYDDNEEKRKPKIINVSGKDITVRTDLLGRYKNKYWEFQKEWRYKVFIYPFSLNEMQVITKDRHMLINVLRNRQLPFSDLYLKLDELKLQDIEITMGPKTSLENKNYVTYLLKKNIKDINAEEHVKDSDIKIK